MARDVTGQALWSDIAPASVRQKVVVPVSTTHGGETVWVLQQGATIGARAQDGGGGVYAFITDATTGLRHIEMLGGVVLSFA